MQPIKTNCRYFTFNTLVIITSGVQRLNSEPTFLSRCYKMLILNFNRPPCFYFSFSQKWSHFKKKLLILLRSIKIQKCHGPTLTGASFTSISKVLMSAVLERLQLRQRRDHFQWHEFSTEFHRNLPMVNKLIGGTATQTGW
jgi:hypothetical protein